MAILVYQLTCTVSDKSYVGITSRSLETRWLEHCARARRGERQDSRLYNAMRKHGLDAFTRQVVATVDTDEEARVAERAFIVLLDTYVNGYNANEGGHGSLAVSDATRRRIGDGRRGKFVGAEGRARMSMAKAGRSECAINFGAHAERGGTNPRAKEHTVLFPDGTVHVIAGLRAFCRSTGAFGQSLRKGFRSNGYTLLRDIGRIDANAADNTIGKGAA